MNQLFRIVVPNTNPMSLFSAFELVTLREYIDYNGGTYLDEVNTSAQYLDNTDAYDEPFYRLYGVYKNTSPTSRKHISDFFNINSGIELLHDLTGREIDIKGY